MWFKNAVFAIALMGAATSGYAKSTCPYEAPLRTLLSQEKAMTAKLNGISSDNVCEPSGKAILNELIAYYEKMAGLVDSAKADKKNCKVDPGTEREQIKLIRDLLSTCGVGSPKKSDKSACVTPPSPSARRTNPNNMCFTAKNTNGESHCVYTFNYTLSGKGLQQGGSVQPGASTERCSLQLGVDIAFGTWTLKASSAK
jgi:hypothetical protein